VCDRVSRGHRFGRCIARPSQWAGQLVGHPVQRPASGSGSNRCSTWFKPLAFRTSRREFPPRQSGRPSPCGGRAEFSQRRASHFADAKARGKTYLRMCAAAVHPVRGPQARRARLRDACAVGRGPHTGLGGGRRAVTCAQHGDDSERSPLPHRARRWRRTASASALLRGTRRMATFCGSSSTIVNGCSITTSRETVPTND
jgi:hypothetical protein